MEKRIITIEEAAEVISLTANAYRIAIHRGLEGIKVPPTTLLHGRRVVLVSVLNTWLDQKERETLINAGMGDLVASNKVHSSPGGRGRPKKGRPTPSARRDEVRG